MTPLSTALREVFTHLHAVEVDLVKAGMKVPIKDLPGPRKNETVFFIGPKGENLLGSRKAEVFLPFVRYGTGTYAEKAVQERLAALLLTSATSNTQDAIQLDPDAVLDHLKAVAPLKALVANRSVAEALIPFMDGTVKVYASPLRLNDNLVIGVADPTHVGFLVSCSKRGLALMVHGDIECCYVQGIEDKRDPEIDSIPRPVQSN